MDLSPKQIVNQLDKYIIGQDDAKKAVAIALRNRYRRAQLPAEDAAVFTELSMGMSDDWREAVPLGATIVRVGRAIFSESYQE